MRGWPSVTKASPARSGKTQLSAWLARAARYVNRIHLSKGLEGAGFLGWGRAAEPEAARCGARARSSPCATLCARCQRWWQPETHFGGPPPRWPAPPPWPRWQVPGAWNRSGAQIHRKGSGLRQRPRLRPPPGPSRWPGLQGAVLPPRAGPSPGAGPRQALRVRRAPCFPRQVRNGRARGDPSPHGGAAAATLLLQPPPPGSRGVVTGAGTLRSGLAARLLKGVRSGGSRRRCCH